MSRITPKREKQAERDKVVFSKRRYNGYLSDDFEAAAVAANLVPPCNFWVLVRLVRLSFPEYAERNYEIIRRDHELLKRRMETKISSLRTDAEDAERGGETKRAADSKAGEPVFREALEDEKRFSTKDLGVLHASKRGNQTSLPFAPLYLVSLEEYIAAKTQRKPCPIEIAHILSALLDGFGRLPDGDPVDPDVLAKKCLRFRERVPLWVEGVKRTTECDSSGENELDRILGTPLQQTATK